VRSDGTSRVECYVQGDNGCYVGAHAHPVPPPSWREVGTARRPARCRWPPSCLWRAPPLTKMSASAPTLPCARVAAKHFLVVCMQQHTTHTQTHCHTHQHSVHSASHPHHRQFFSSLTHAHRRFLVQSAADGGVVVLPRRGWLLWSLQENTGKHTAHTPPFSHTSHFVAGRRRSSVPVLKNARATA
jgi:hypothetical protein